MRYLTCTAFGIQLNEECGLQMLKGIYQQQCPAVRVPSKVTKSFVIRVFLRKNKSLMCSCCARSIHDLWRDSSGNWAGGVKQGVLFTRLIVLFYSNQVQQEVKPICLMTAHWRRYLCCARRFQMLNLSSHSPRKHGERAIRLETQFSFHTKKTFIDFIYSEI